MIPAASKAASAKASPVEGDSLVPEATLQVKEQKPLSEDIPQATSARDLLKTIQSGNRPRSQAQIYLAVG